MDQVVLNFLGNLRENNNREWFQKNKDQYIRAREVFEAFINELIPAIRSFDPHIGMITAKDCTFRIYRDVRFSKDKSPYKTNMGAYISRGGRSTQFAGYYVHAEPGGSFLAGGIYMPQSEVLKKVREEIFYNIEEFKQIIGESEFARVFGKMDDSDKLVNPPKGFPKEFPDIDLLKFKSYVVVHSVPDKIFLSEGYPEYCLEVFTTLLPLNNFINRIFMV